MNSTDELKLYRGDDYVMPNGIVIHCPTLGDICEYGEKEYLGMVSLFTSTVIDRCAQLDDMGIDYTQISNFEMFFMFKDLLTVNGGTKDGLSTISTKVIFGNLDFSEFKLATVNEKYCLVNNDGIILDESSFETMTAYLRKIHGMPEPLYKKVTNEFAKKQLIEDARNDADFQRKMAAFKGEHSQYQPLISALVNHPSFKYNWHTVWDISVYAFFDSLKRIQIIDNANHLYTGLYSGCIEYKNVKKDLDWLKPIN